MMVKYGVSDGGDNDDGCYKMKADFNKYCVVKDMKRILLHCWGPLCQGIKRRQTICYTEQPG